MADTLHSKLLPGARHALQNLEYPTENDRIDGTNELNSIVPDADNIDQIAKVISTNQLYRLLGLGPPLVWEPLGSSADPTLDDAYNNFGISSADVNIDNAEGQGDLTFLPANITSFIVDVSNCTGEDDGAIFQNGADFLKFLRTGTDEAKILADVEYIKLEAAVGYIEFPKPGEDTEFRIDSEGDAMELYSDISIRIEASGSFQVGGTNFIFMNASNDVSITTTGGDVTLKTTGATNELILGARATTITLNESGNTSLSGGYTATSLIGAHNEIRSALTTHATGTGADHSYINQDVTTAGSPSFVNATLSGKTQGSVLFAGAGGVISEDNSNLFWDDTNNRLGLGTASPSELLDISGKITVSSAGLMQFIDAGDKKWLSFYDGSSENFALNANLAGGGDSNVLLFSSDVVTSILSMTRNSGYVGVGTITPSYKLSVASVDTTEQVGISHDNTDAKMSISAGSQYTEHEAPVSLADDASFDLPDSSAGFCTILVGDSEEYAFFRWDTTAAVNVIDSSGSNISTSDDDGKFCIFDNGTAVRVRNRLGAAKKVIFDCNYTTSPT